MTEGQTNEVAGRFCGKKSAFAVTVDEQFVRVHFHSDGGIEEKGFQMSYFVLKNFKDTGKCMPRKTNSRISFMIFVL